MRPTKKSIGFGVITIKTSRKYKEMQSNIQATCSINQQEQETQQKQGKSEKEGDPRFNSQTFISERLTVRRVAGEAAEDDEDVVDVQLAHDLVGLLLGRGHGLADARYVRVVPRVVVHEDRPVRHRRYLVTAINIVRLLDHRRISTNHR